MVVSLDSRSGKLKFDNRPATLFGEEVAQRLGHCLGLAAQYGLGISDMKTLSILLQEGPMTAGEIGNRLGLTSGAVTTLIDRLERRDLVRRRRDETDRRKVIVAVNQEKLAQGPNVYRSMGEAFTSLLGSYTTEQLEFLAAFYKASIELTRQEITKLAKDRG